ncbi:hypothetical protein CC86DRAFT_141130 [Ophiobolus disseminans]|uniref:Uncharacterized protein n=1 Tax=Ophiobolus disseminans TaxID=1469910 RepID=A0A6A7AFY1_9PLEO|nr:hypothetical protein CC86DRAFT_141130 [Ophiobolus disseminans]
MCIIEETFPTPKVAAVLTPWVALVASLASRSRIRAVSWSVGTLWLFAGIKFAKGRCWDTTHGRNIEQWPRASKLKGESGRELVPLTMGEVDWFMRELEKRKREEIERKRKADEEWKRVKEELKRREEGGSGEEGRSGTKDRSGEESRSGGEANSREGLCGDDVAEWTDRCYAVAGMRGFVAYMQSPGARMIPGRGVGDHVVRGGLEDGRRQL